ncbi:MAG: hypothetical protein DCC67_03395 [Planctomycetota bacterium]|nr:MAG: hypothetical protein DCC67_03395 [Planctomycetota bacterium]
MVLSPALLAKGQAAGGVPPTQPYVNPTYATAYAPQAAPPQQYAAPVPQYTAPPQQYAAPAYAMPTPAAPAYGANPYAGQPYPAAQPAPGYGPSVYTAQADPQIEYAPGQAAVPVLPQPAPAADIVSPPINEQPRAIADGQGEYDAATAYGYPAHQHCNPTPGYVQGGCAQQPYGAYGASCSSNWGGSSPAYSGPSMTCAPPIIWEVYGGALLMFRDDENHYFYSYDSAIESNQYLDAREAYDDFLPGFEVGFRRFNACTCSGWEGLYWGLFPGDQLSAVYATDVTGNLDPILDFSQLDYNGTTADNFTNAAQIHQVQRYTEIHNAELNRVWAAPGCGTSCSPWSVTTLAGFRYFRMKDYLEFASDVNDTLFTGEADELYYSVDTENDLYGGQFGAQFQRRTAGRLSFNGGVKAGVFCNSASATSWIGGSAGTAIINNGPNAGREWLITAEKDDVAFLGELKAGLAYQLGENWRLMSDYRVIGVSGLALPTNQIYPDLRGVNDVELLKTNGSLFLHGVFVGAEYVF